MRLRPERKREAARWATRVSREQRVKIAVGSGWDEVDGVGNRGMRMRW